jgi:tRNA modification GTPase
VRRILVDMKPAALPDTIAAVATPPGIGGIGIVRVSGPAVPAIASALLGTFPKARHALHTQFYDTQHQPIDVGIALYFPAPHSFTGDDVLELQGHGGPMVMDQLLRHVLALGARPARAGEFSERAFLNGKLDLAQAEAVADLIESASVEAARAALNSLQGAFSRRIQALVEDLIRLRLHIESALDFPDEEIDFLADRALVEQSDRLERALFELQADSHQGQLLHDGMTVVLAGRPNAGKSSLLNLLTQQESAIVSAIPGTTRDLLRERIQIDGLPLHVIDTAGLRIVSDEIESEGVRRAREAMGRADRVLLVIDDQQTEEGVLRELLKEVSVTTKITVVHNKIDLSGRAAGFTESGDSGYPEIALSALDGRGLDSLYAHLKASMGYLAAGEGTFSARRRHLEAIGRARAHLAAARDELGHHRGELAAEQLRLAQQALGEITGEFTSDDLLGRIFSSFCIGK